MSYEEGSQGHQLQMKEDTQVLLCYQETGVQGFYFLILLFFTSILIFSPF